MNTLLKKILIILIVVLILALIVFLIYSLLFKKPLDEEEELGPGQLPEGKEGEFKPGTDKNGEVTPSPELKIKAISAERVLAPTLSADRTKVTYYSQYNGHVWQTAFDGSGLTRISLVDLDNLADIIWSPDRTKVISVYQDELGEITKYFYDYETDKVSPLNRYAQEIAWSSDSNKIVYQYTNTSTNDNNLSIANPDGTNWQNIFRTRMKDLNLDWVNSGIVFYEKPSGSTRSSLFLINPLTKNLTKVLSDIYGMATKWSPQGDKFIYSETDNKGSTIALYLALKDGTGKKSIGVSGLVEKCVWSLDNRTVFCAIPKNINRAEVLPDDFYKGSFASDDEFWKINLETKQKTALLESWERGDQAFDAIDLFLSPLEDYLFFVNKKDGLLYSIEL